MSLICWSGGLDSTLVLYDLAREHRDGVNFQQHGVRALSIIHPQISQHRKAVERSRKALKRKFREAGLTIAFLEVEITQTAAAWKEQNFLGSAANPQSFLWLTMAANYLEPVEDLYSGYIRGDDFWHRAEKCQTAFAGLQSFAGREGRLIHQLEWVDKAEVITRTKELGLYDLAWWCEDLKPPRGKPCGKCPSCRTNDAALWKLSQPC